jgi:hypothetical protein
MASVENVSASTNATRESIVWPSLRPRVRGQMSNCERHLWTLDTFSWVGSQASCGSCGADDKRHILLQGFTEIVLKPSSRSIVAEFGAASKELQTVCFQPLWFWF